MVQQFLLHLKTQKAAAIFKCYLMACACSFPISPIYGATKSGLRAYTKSLRVQLKNTSIKVFELIAQGAKTSRNDKFGKDVDPKTLIDADKLIAVVIKGLKNDNYEIYPDISKAIKQ